MPTPHGSRGGMAFSAAELEVLRSALAAALRARPGTEDRTRPTNDDAGRHHPGRDLRPYLRLAEAIEETAAEDARYRAFLLADLARHRAALPGAATGYLTRLEEALTLDCLPHPDDLAALRMLRAHARVPAEARRRAGLLHRCAELLDRPVRTRLRVLPGGRTPRGVALASVEGCTAWGAGHALVTHEGTAAERAARVTAARHAASAVGSPGLPAARPGSPEDPSHEPTPEPGAEPDANLNPEPVPSPDAPDREVPELEVPVREPVSERLPEARVAEEQPPTGAEADSTEHDGEADDADPGEPRCGGTPEERDAGEPELDEREPEEWTEPKYESEAPRTDETDQTDEVEEAGEPEEEGGTDEPVTALPLDAVATNEPAETGEFAPAPAVTTEHEATEHEATVRDDAEHEPGEHEATRYDAAEHEATEHEVAEYEATGALGHEERGGHAPSGQPVQSGNVEEPGDSGDAGDSGDSGEPGESGEPAEPGEGTGEPEPEEEQPERPAEPAAPSPSRPSDTPGTSEPRSPSPGKPVPTPAEVFPPRRRRLPPPEQAADRVLSA
ncbi:hypothetical protein [Streptomyces sp. AJS327]|uniref:hypothetical protein n=1 Tax=Streptomyces sp. AJS327 TaxID=2545265 RepID=UPI0015DFD165|nr:hypothetical protein [Streptomyces sp. AJS327]